MNEPNNLIYPTVNLFLYDLRDGLGQENNSIETNRRNFWKKVFSDVPKTELLLTENPEADYLRLAGNTFYNDAKTSHLDGYYSVRLLGDTYALQINCSGKYNDPKNQKKNDQKQSISNLKDIKQEIVNWLNKDYSQPEVLSEKRGTIGQTWVVWAQKVDSQEDRQIAEKCCQQLIPNPKWKPNFQEHGQWLSAGVFEYWHLPSNWSKDWDQFSQENYHIIIMLFPAGKSLDKVREDMANAYKHLTHLLYYRHKVLWSYWQSRRKKVQLKERYEAIKKLIDRGIEYSEKLPSQSLFKDLESILKEALNVAPKYSFDLNFLDAQSYTIRVNIDNYQKRLKYIAPEDSGINLKNLQQFSSFAEEKYWQQVKTDYAILSPGLQLLENLTKTIDGMIAVEQTKRDRSLNKTIIIVGIGLGASQITTSVMITQNRPEPETPFYQTSAFLGGISTGILTSAIATLIIAIIPRIIRK